MTYKLTEEEKTLKLNTLKGAIQAAVEGKIDWKQYHFVTDEDGYLFFIKKDDQHRDKDLEPEDLERWPCNQYDGIVIFKIHTSESRGLKITESFLNALKIPHLG